MDNYEFSKALKIISGNIYYTDIYGKSALIRTVYRAYRRETHDGKGKNVGRKLI